MSSYVGGPFDGKTFTTPHDHLSLIVLQYPDVVDGKLARGLARYKMVCGMRVFVSDEEYRTKYLGERRKAPWNDYAGNPIYEGDWIRHPVDPEWQTGVVEFHPDLEEAWRQWKVRYPNGDLLSLALQIGDKGQATVVKNG